MHFIIGIKTIITLQWRKFFSVAYYFLVESVVAMQLIGTKPLFEAADPRDSRSVLAAPLFGAIRPL